MELKPQPRPIGTLKTTENGKTTESPIFRFSPQALDRLLADLERTPDPEDPADDWKRS